MGRARRVTRADMDGTGHRLNRMEGNGYDRSWYGIGALGSRARWDGRVN